MALHLVENTDSGTTLAAVEIPDKFFKRIDTGDDDWNEALGGGFVSGSLTLFTGEPNAGKSTLALILLDCIRRYNGIRCTYFALEESKYMIKQRMQRLNETSSNIYIQGDFLLEDETNDIDQIINKIKRTDSRFNVIDSLQKIKCDRKTNTLKHIVEKLYSLTRQGDTTILAIGQSIKSGRFAGPQAIAHEIDCHIHVNNMEAGGCYIEKNRFGKNGITF